MIIIGAGLSGLLAGCITGGTVFEKNEEIDMKIHTALFRCKSDSIGNYLGIPFKKVTVQKSIWLNGKEVLPSPRITNLYSRKVTDHISNRSIFDTDTVTRFIPPGDFKKKLSDRCSVRYGCGDIDVKTMSKDFNPIISTIPMPIILRQFGHTTDELFKTSQIYVKRAIIKNCNAFCTVYYPGTDNGAYRASITGNILSIEAMQDSINYIQVFKSLGINDSDIYGDFESSINPTGKISSIDNDERENIIFKLTMEHRVFSLGRFATWRPKVMLDDVMNDIFVIRKLINNNYEAMKQKNKGGIS